MILWKWDKRQHRYLPFGIPNDRKVGVYREDLTERVDCANCGRRMVFGESFTSLTIHTPMGIGYAVCEQCHREEVKEKLEAEGK